jgi:hypothetical protein
MRDTEVAGGGRLTTAESVMGIGSTFADNSKRLSSLCTIVRPSGADLARAISGARDMNPKGVETNYEEDRVRCRAVPSGRRRLELVSSRHPRLPIPITLSLPSEREDFRCPT